MDTPKPKLYHKHEMDSRGHLQTYCSENVFGEDSLNFHMKKIHDLLAAGNFKGKRVFDISIGSSINQLQKISDLFLEFTILKQNDACIMELNKWLAKRMASDVSYSKSDKEDLNKEENLKKSIKRVLKCDFQKANITDPEVLGQADCILTCGILDVVSQDQNEYIKCLQNMKKLLRTGGMVIVIGGLNATYYKVNNDIHHIFTYNESFLRKALANEGFKIEDIVVQDRKIQSDLTDCKQVFSVTATKEAA